MRCSLRLISATSRSIFSRVTGLIFKPALGRAVAAADLVDMHQEIGEPALDGFEIAEPRIGSVEPLDQLGDAVLKVAQSRVIGVGELHPFELLDQAGEKLLEFARHRVARFGWRQ